MVTAVCRWIPSDHTARLGALTFTPGQEIRRFLEVSSAAIGPCSGIAYCSMGPLAPISLKRGCMLHIPVVAKYL